MEYIEIVEVVRECLNYLDDPTDDLKQRKFEEFKSKLMVIDYMPCYQKKLLIKRFYADFSALRENVVNYAVDFDVLMVFDCLLAYTNINPDIMAEFKAHDVADVLYFSGLIDTILEVCEADYRRLEHMVDKAITFDNLQQTLTILPKFDNEDVRKLLKQFEEYKNSVGADTLKELSDIVNMNDPFMKHVDSEMQKSIIDGLRKAEDKNEDSEGAEVQPDEKNTDEPKEE